MTDSVTVPREILEETLIALQELKPFIVDTSFRAIEADVARILAIEKLQALLNSPNEPCTGKDPLCPCKDGDACHYKDSKGTKALPLPKAPT
jgi:hypothetical protein